jgi:hypothetical protein
MPILNTLDERPTLKIVLPSSKPNDEAFVVAYTEPLADDIAFIGRFRTDLDQVTIASIYRVIKDWNFTEKDGKKVEITMDNVRRLSATDLAEILDKTGINEKYERVSQLEDAKKKPLSSTFPQKRTGKKAKK